MEGGQSVAFKGYRDFMTGVLPAPGIYVRNDTVVYSGTEHSQLPQGDLTLKISYVTDIAAGLLVTPYRILGADYALGVRGAFVDLGVNQTLRPRAPFPTALREERHAGYGDMVLTPLVLGWHSGRLHWNVATSLRTPAGDYAKTRIANTGRNVWTLGLQSGITWFDPASGWDISGDASYMLSSENSDTHYRSGDLVHVDFALGKLIMPHVEFGLVGYYSQQLKADGGAGAIYGDRKLRIAALGPGLTVDVPAGKLVLRLTAKYYREFAAQNTTQGDVGMLSIRARF